MKEWIKKLCIYTVIFGVIFFVIYNIIPIPKLEGIPQGYTKVVHAASRWQSALALSSIVSVVLYEIMLLFRYINTTVDSKSFRSNLITFTILTILLMIVAVFFYFVYRYTSINIFGS